MHDVSGFRALLALLSLALGVACAVRAAPGAAPASREWIPGPRGRLRVDDGGSGDGVPVVFVHGNGGNRTQWAATLVHLRQSRRAIAFDLAGMGDSELPPDIGQPAALHPELVHPAADDSRFPASAKAAGVTQIVPKVTPFDESSGNRAYLNSK